MFAPTTFKVRVDGGGVRRILKPVAHLKNNSMSVARQALVCTANLVRICEKQQVIETEVDNRSQASNFSPGSLPSKKIYSCLGMRDLDLKIESVKASFWSSGRSFHTCMISNNHPSRKTK